VSAAVSARTFAIPDTVWGDLLVGLEWLGVVWRIAGPESQQKQEAEKWARRKAGNDLGRWGASRKRAVEGWS